MSMTERQLVNRILNDLSVIGNGEDAEIEDFSDIQSRLTTIVAELNVRQIMNVATTKEIPDELFEPLVEYVKAKAGPGYGKPDPDPNLLSILEDRLREICWPKSGRETMRTDPILSAGVRYPRRRNPDFRNGC